MQSSILFIHSILRYFILLFALIVVIQSLTGMLGKKKVNATNKRMALFLLICCDLQLLFGLFLYFTRGWFGVLTAGGDVMKDSFKRFWAVEHGVGMIIAIILVHVGYSVLKKHMDDDRKLKRLFWCSFIALGIFFATIPWEGRQVVGRPNIPSMH
jgi:hypothetical protein